MSEFVTNTIAGASSRPTSNGCVCSRNGTVCGASVRHGQQEIEGFLAITANYGFEVSRWTAAQGRLLSMGSSSMPFNPERSAGPG